MKKWNHSPQVRSLVFEKSHGRCWYCGTTIIRLDGMFSKIPPNAFCVDHIDPEVLDFSNLVPTCWHCNSIKRHRNLEEFRAVIILEKYIFKKYPRQKVERKLLTLLYSDGLLLLPEGITHQFYFEKKAMLS